MKKRLDIALFQRGLVNTHSKAQSLIMAGKIKVNGAIETKAGHNTKDTDIIEIIEDVCPYVSRGGLKLAHALKKFDITVKERICLDVGASTGGFSDCLIKSGAKLVYAVDVGKGQLDDTLSKNPKLKFIPHTNARNLTPDIFDAIPSERFDFTHRKCSGLRPSLAAIDVSFISLELILLPVIRSLEKPADVIALIKPQFELERKHAPKGVVKNPDYRTQVIEKLQTHLKEKIFPLHKVQDKGIIPSPIKGAKGNIEYLWHIKIDK